MIERLNQRLYEFIVRCNSSIDLYIILFLTSQQDGF